MKPIEKCPEIVRLLIAMVAFITLVAFGVYGSLDQGSKAQEQFTIALVIAVLIVAGLVVLQLVDQERGR